MKKIKYTIPILIMTLSVLVSPAGAEQSYMLGNWDGKRESLDREKGVTFASTYVCDILGDTVGGMQQAARYDSSMGWDINFDLEKFAGITGTQFHISGLWRAGQNLSKAVIGNDMVVSSIYGHQQFRFYGLYLDKLFLDDKLSIRAGRIAAGDDFACSPLYWTFVSNSIDGNPITIPINLFFSCYPTAVWGARAKWDLPKDFRMIAGLYNADPGVERDSMYGLDFSLRLKRGLFTAYEISYIPNQKPGDKGMPGNYKAGVYYSSSVFRDKYADTNGSAAVITGQPYRKHIGNYGVYFHADQLIYREGPPGTDQGLTPILAAALAPSNLNKFSFFIENGLIYKGLIPTRDADVSAVQFVYARYSSELRRSQVAGGSQDPQRYEIVLELTHKINITPWMYLQPDMQYIINPGGTGTIKDALVIGTRFGVIF